MHALCGRAAGPGSKNLVASISSCSAFGEYSSASDPILSCLPLSCYRRRTSSASRSADSFPSADAEQQHRSAAHSAVLLQTVSFLWQEDQSLGACDTTCCHSHHRKKKKQFALQPLPIPRDFWIFYRSSKPYFMLCSSWAAAAETHSGLSYQHPIKSTGQQRGGRFSDWDHC